MNSLRVFAIALATLLPSAVFATSDGYLEWTSVTFEDAAGWRVHVATSGDRMSDGFIRVSALGISRHGVVVEIPDTATAEIRDPLLDQIQLLSMCCSDEVKLEIPVFQTDDLREACKRRVWEIAIANGKFVAASAQDVKDEACG